MAEKTCNDCWRCSNRKNARVQIHYSGLVCSMPPSSTLAETCMGFTPRPREEKGAVPLGVPPQAHLSPVVALILSQKARANGYRSLMEGTFPYADKLEMKARAAWCRFRVSCERFNRGLPGSWSPYEPDSWRPLIQVMPEATRYSRHAMKRVQEETLDLPPELVERERYEAQKMGYAEQVRFLKWYGEQKKP